MKKYLNFVLNLLIIVGFIYWALWMVPACMSRKVVDMTVWEIRTCGLWGNR